MHPPGAHPWATGGPLQEGGDPNVEDKEVTFQGDRGWGPSKPLPQPQAPLIQRRMLAVSSVPLLPD